MRDVILAGGGSAIDAGRAAARIQAVFRGRMGRREAGALLDAQLAELEAQEARPSRDRLPQ